MHQHTQHRRWIFSLVITIIALTVVTPALADYIGPNRTVTETHSSCKIVLNECQYVPAKDDYRFKSVNDWSCSNEDKPWRAYPSDPPRDCMASTVGDQYWSREEVTRTETITYPPATINSSLVNCTLRNGWCISIPQLSLNGSEPVAGYNIFAIEGTLNGQTFGCTNTSCNVPLIQGNNDFTYWALSSFGDSSTMGALTTKVDTQLPTITSNLTGTAGSNGWYLSPVSLISSASDSTSGLASFTCTRDGTALVACNSITFTSDGPHTLVLTARDHAGHIRNLTHNPSIDTQNPTLNASLNGTMGSNNWYTAAVLNASASDPLPGSGLSTFQYNFDGAGWTDFPASGILNLAEGKHTVDIRAIDKAGRTVSSSKSYWLDSSAPDASLDSSGTLGLNNWFITSPILTASASDNISGLDLFEYSLDNSAWTAYSTPISLGEGVHNISIWAQDQAGLVTQVDRSYQVDTRLPQIAGSLSGTPGMNGWYISEVTISASASDPQPGSDIDAFVYTLNGSTETVYTDSLLLSDGKHTLRFIAHDKAGLSHTVEQSFNVDTVSPSLTINTMLPNWVSGTITLGGSANDNGSGLSSVEISFDGGQTWQSITGTTSWSHVWSTTDGLNGVREVRLRATDQAGLNNEQTINVAIDNQSPAINMPDSWLQWDTVSLNISDEHSGLSEARVEISDPQGRWPTRVTQLDPTQFPLALKWDRRFADGTIAEAGTYDVKVFATDQLGNTTNKSATIRVVLEILPPGPTSTQPSTIVPVNTATPVLSLTATPLITPTRTLSTQTPKATQNVTVQMFGTIEPQAQTSPTPTSIPTLRATPTQSNTVDWLESIFVPETNEQTTTEVTVQHEENDSPPLSRRNSVLWGTAATAAIAAAAAYAQEEQRRREEEIARQKALEEQEEERREKKKEKKTAKMEAIRAQEEAWEQARLDAWDSAAIDAKVERFEAEESKAWVTAQAEIREQYIAKKQAELEKKQAQEKSEELQGNLLANYAALQHKESEKEKESLLTQPKKKTLWDKAWDFVDEHQTEIALGLGILAGTAVVVLTAGMATPLVAAAALAGGAAIAAGGSAAVMTMAVNKHYNRPWHENMLRNVTIAGGAALAVSTAGFVFKAAAAGIGSYCSMHTSTCARVEPVFNALDKVEETWLRGKLAVQTWRGDQAGAAETAFELHSEYADGGMPGNAVIKELGDQVSHLSKNAAPLIKKYGNDVIPLLIKHGDEGLELIQKYGTDGIVLLHKHGNDATDLLVLDDDVLDYVMEQGDDAVAALSRWSKEDLLAHGPALALRAKKDAEVLASIKKLTSSGPIDPKQLTKEQKALIDAIAANSTQYADNGQVVLGKWVDNSSGFVQTAQDTGSVHYNPHPDMWTMLGKLGDAKQEEVAWLINKQVVQKGIDKGLPFEYTLNGVPNDSLVKEGNAVEAIFAGATDTEIMKILRSDYVPIRMKELKELQKAGYEYVFDEATNSYVLMLP